MLVPPGFSPPLDLLEGLARRQVVVREVADAPGAMAELAAAAEPFAALVVVQTPSVEQAERLMEAVGRHFPSVARWQYRTDQATRLSAWAANERSGVGVSTGAAEAIKPSVSRQEPTIHVADEQSLRASAQLTQEELAMLLDDRSDDPDRENAG